MTHEPGCTLLAECKHDVHNDQYETICIACGTCCTCGEVRAYQRGRGDAANDVRDYIQLNGLLCELGEFVTDGIITAAACGR